MSLICQGIAKMIANEWKKKKKKQQQSCHKIYPHTSPQSKAQLVSKE